MAGTIDPKAVEGFKKAFDTPEEEDPKESFWDRMFSSVPEPSLGEKISGSLKRERKRAGVPE